MLSHLSALKKHNKHYSIKINSQLSAAWISQTIVETTTIGSTL